MSPNAAFDFSLDSDPEVGTRRRFGHLIVFCVPSVDLLGRRDAMSLFQFLSAVTFAIITLNPQPESQGTPTDVYTISGDCEHAEYRKRFCSHGVHQEDVRRSGYPMGIPANCNI